MEYSENFKIDARVILNLGRHSIKDHTTALVELVKNSYDADAGSVEVDIFIADKNSYIRISDNGCGMSKNQLRDNWLRIGYSEKTNEKFSSKRNRRKTGEKGIGRISADRLGAQVKVISKIEGAAASSLFVNWDDFDVEGRDISEIKILMQDDVAISLPRENDSDPKSGTELIITDLRQEWSRANIENLYEELSVLTPPFNTIGDFSIKINTNVEHQFREVVSSKWFLAAEIELNFSYDGKGSELIFTVKDKYTKKEKIEVIEWGNLVQRANNDEAAELVDAPRCGPFDLKLWFYPRISSTVQGTTFSLSNLREFLDNNSGVKIYRDNIAVKPYGFRSGQSDWLGLAERKAIDPAGISRESYKITPNQLVGAIFISRDRNQFLIDSSAREGLVESDELNDLKTLVLGAINLIETHRYNLNKDNLINPKKDDEKKPHSSSQAVRKIRSDLDSVKAKLRSIEGSVPKHLAQPLKQSIEEVDKVIDDTEKTVEAILNENRVLSGLATLGITSAVFGHETQSAINVVNQGIKNAKNLIASIPTDYLLVEKEINRAFKHAKRVASWGVFALARVQTEKRKLGNRNVKNIIESTVEELKPSFEAVSIAISLEAEPIVAKTYPMDIESIVVNFITNSYAACINGKGKRKINIKLRREDKDGKSGYEISVADSGPGVHKDFIDRIWEPLFSTKSNNSSKKTGTGLGLTIVKSIVDELDGTVKVENNSELSGARFSVWLPKS